MKFLVRYFPSLSLFEFENLEADFLDLFEIADLRDLDFDDFLADLAELSLLTDDFDCIFVLN